MMAVPNRQPVEVRSYPERAGTMSQTSTAAAVALDDVRAVRERRQRVRLAVRSGGPVASADMREDEHYAKVPYALLGALSRAQRLTPTERQYLDALLLHSVGMRSDYAVCDWHECDAPTTADWCAWLGWQTEQVCNVRRSLLQKRIIRCLDGDASRIAFNEWEEWAPDVFARHEPRRGAGAPQQPRRRTRRNTTALPEMQQESSTNYVLATWR